MLTGVLRFHFTQLRCSRCQWFLGRLVPPSEGSLKRTCVRLEKHAISTSPSEGTFPPLLLFAADQMEQLSRAHATRYFFLTDEDSGSRVAILWLFQPMLSLSLSLSGNVKKALGCGTVKPGEQMVLLGSKIFFIEDKVHRDNADADADADGVPLGVQEAEAIHFPSASCSQLMEALKATNELYPPSRRMFGNKWKIGWIPRCRGEDVE